MSVFELPQVEVAVPDDRPRVAAPPRRVAGHPASEGVEITDAAFAHLFLIGAVSGIPVLYAIVVAIDWLAAPGQAGVLLAAVMPALFAGWYFGGIVALTVLELRQERRGRPRHPVAAQGRPRRAAGKPATVGA